MRSSVESGGWFVVLGGELCGPISRETLVEVLADHDVDDDAPVWNASSSDEWTTLREVDGLASEVAGRRASRARGDRRTPTAPIPLASPIERAKHESTSGELDIRGALRAMCTPGRPMKPETRAIQVPPISAPEISAGEPATSAEPAPSSGRASRRERQIWIGAAVGLLVPAFGAFLAWYGDASSAPAPAPELPNETLVIEPPPRIAVRASEAEVVAVTPPVEAVAVVQPPHEEIIAVREAEHDEERSHHSRPVVVASAPPVTEEEEAADDESDEVAEDEADASPDEGEALADESDSESDGESEVESEGDSETDSETDSESDSDSEAAETAETAAPPAAPEPPRERSLEELIAGAVPTDQAPSRPVESAPSRSAPSDADIVRALDAQRSAMIECTAAHAVAALRLTIDGPTGRVTAVFVDGVFAGTPAGSCIARAVRRVHVEPFAQRSYSMSYPYRL